MLEHEKYMKMAIEEAKKGEGFTSPNPLVGAVIVKDGKVIGIGYHKKCGENHAEINAFLDAKEKGENIEDADIYVTLEPCSHYGKTPPCADAIIKNKLKRVIIGCVDSNPKVAGNGIKKLKDAGIEVIVNVLEEECRKLNEVFFYYIANKRPFIVHRFRNKYSAIMVGINTVIEDNPTLNCRLPNTRNPIRIILDSSLKIDLDSNICKTAKEIKTFIATIRDDDKKIKELENLGIEIIKTENYNGKVSLKDLMRILGEEKDIDSVYVEGGAALHASLLKEKLVNKALIYIAPKIFGGIEAKSPIGGEGIDDPNDAVKLTEGSITKIEDDLFLEYYIKY